MYLTQLGLHAGRSERRKGGHMGLLDFLRGPDINKGIEEYKRTEGAALIDVRSPEEYSERN